MRRTSVPPAWRAASQLYSAVRAPPMCSAPVGEGAKRTRMDGPALYSPPGLGTRLEDHVDRRLGRAAHAREAGLGQHAAQARLAGLRAEREADLLRARRRHAHLR